MGRDAMKAGENPCFRCRKEAAKYNDKLSSREGAAEALGVSASSLADYELGITKVIPVDKVVLMADLYNAPELKAWYCTSECPIGKSFPMPSSELSSVERTTLNLLRQLRQEDVEEVKEKLIDIKVLDSKYSLDRIRGKVEDVYFRNIEILNGPFPVSIIRGFEMANEMSRPQNIYFENIKILGQEIQSPNQLRMVVELAHNLHFDGKTYCVKTGER